MNVSPVYNLLNRMPQSLLTGQLKENRHIGFGVFIVHSSMGEQWEEESVGEGTRKRRGSEGEGV